MFKTKIDAEIAKKCFSGALDYDKELEVVYFKDVDKRIRLLR